jgi:hypothetical protein
MQGQRDYQNRFVKLFLSFSYRKSMVNVELIMINYRKVIYPKGVFGHHGFVRRIGL